VVINNKIHILDAQVNYYPYKQMMKQTEYLKTLYANRFDHKQRRAKNAMWKVLIDSFLQAHVGRNNRVLDIAGGYCEFINQVEAREKFLIDLNPDAQDFADPDVKVLHLDILSDINENLLPFAYFDAIFVSNFFEHLSSQGRINTSLILLL
jgi:hypothetical protein